MKKSMVLGLLAAAIIIGGCATGKTAESKKKSTNEDIIAAGLLRGAGLGLDWQNDVPLNKGEKILHMIIAAKYAYIITDANMVFCYERFDGTLRFVRQFAKPGLPIKEPVEYEGALYTVVGNELWKLDPATASVSIEQTLEHSSICPVAFTTEDMYVCGLNNRISCYNKEGNWLKFELTASNDSQITSLLIEGEYMWFATKKGNIHCASSYAPIRYWSFNATDEISGRIAKDEKHIYISSKDTMLYKINAMTGYLAWKKPLGSALLSGAILYDDYVYQSSSQDGVYALNLEDGGIVWQEPEGESFVARSDDKVFVFTKNNLLSVMSNSKGSPELKINFAPVDMAAKNTFDNNIYVLSKEGKFAKISER